MGPSFDFQQDNDPKQSSRLCKDYLTKKESDGVLHQMTWPPQSPDLNPIEMVWDELDRSIVKSVVCKTPGDHVVDSREMQEPISFSSSTQQSKQDVFKNVHTRMHGQHGPTQA